MKKLLLTLIPFAAFASASDVLTHYTPNDPPPPSPTEEVVSPCEITPGYYPIEGHKVNFGVQLDFLYWYSNVTNLTYGIKRVVNPTETNIQPPATFLGARKKESFDADWNPAFRIGLICSGFVDSWDLFANWTYYHSSQSKLKTLAPLSLHPTDAPVGTEYYTSTWMPGPNDIVFSQLSAHLQLRYNQFDLAMGRKFWISKTLALHPYMGLRGLDSELYFRVKGSRPDRADPPITNIRQGSKSKQKLSSIGLLAGTDANWYFHPEWSVLARGSVALTYGKYRVRTRLDSIGLFDATGHIFVQSSSKTPDTLYRIQTFLDSALGISWDKTLYDNTFHLHFDASWETHLILDYTQFHWPNIYINHPNTDGNLILSGLTVRGRIDF